LQHELARLPVNDTRYAELAVREQVLLLLEPFDPGWVDRVRRYTTPPPCRDIAKLVPELAPFARTTTRLHPHRMPGERDPLDSKIGGHFLWPAQEDWPMCPEHHISYVPVLQLRQCDVPEIRFYLGTDLFQL